MHTDYIYTSNHSIREEKYIHTQYLITYIIIHSHIYIYVFIYPYIHNTKDAKSIACSYLSQGHTCQIKKSVTKIISIQKIQKKKKIIH